MASAARRLREIASAGEQQWARLRRTLARLDWLSSAALLEARHTVVDAVAEYLRIGQRLAWDLDLPLPVVLRQLVVLAPTTAFPMHRLAWCVLAVDPEQVPGCDFPGWMAYLDRRARQFGVVFPLDRLPQEPPRLGVADIDQVLPPASRARFLALLLHTGTAPLQTRRSALVALRRALRHCSGAPTEQMAEWCQEAWVTWRLPHFSRAAFDRLPTPLRRAILADTATGRAARRALLTRTFRRQLHANPATHPDTPAGLAARPQRDAEALTALRRRDFAQEVLADYLADPDNSPLLPLDADRAIWHPDPDATWTPPAPAVTAVLARLPNSYLVEALRFLAASPAERLSQIPPGAALRSLLPPGDWLATFVAGTPDDQAALLTQFSTLEFRDAVERADLLTAAFPRAQTSPAVLAGFERHWLQLATAREEEACPSRLLNWFRLHPDALAELPRAADLTALLLDLLEDQDTLGDAPAAVALLSAGLLRQLARHHFGRTGSLVRALTAKLLRHPDPAETALASLLEQLAGAGRLLLLEVIPDQLRPARFQRLCLAWPTPPLAGAGCLLRYVSAGSGEGPAWLVLLTRLGRVRLPVPQRLRELATLAGPHVLRAAFRAYPDAFAEHGPELMPLRELLPFAFCHVRVARVLEQQVPRERLVAELDWVRTTWQHAPSIAAALELALCFSLRDARFLCQLALQVRPLRSRERGHTFDHLYRTFERPKRHGTRTITAPLPRLKRLQRRLLANGFATVPLHETAHGFRPGASILTNATPHTGQRLVVNLDIAGFFPGTGYRLILRACRRLAAGRLSPRALYFLADLCSQGGALPTGAPTSPAIANIILSPVDQALSKAAARRGAVYTRYADDLTISGDGDCHALIPFVKRVLAELGYRVERRKVNLFRRGRRQLVTGLVVNDKPNWPRRLRRLLRAAVDRRSRGQPATWQGQPLSDARLRGLIAFLNLTQPAEAARHRARLPELYPNRRSHSPPANIPSD